MASRPKSKAKRETVSLKTFLSWDACTDFSYNVDENNKVDKLTCKICSKYLPEIRREAKLRNISGQGFQSLISYVDGVEYIHKSNVYRHVKSGSLHHWAKQKFCINEADSTSSNSACHPDNEAKRKELPIETFLNKNSHQLYKHHLNTALSFNAFEVCEQNYTKRLVCACADGAATNLGRLNGALTCLKTEDRPWLLIIHCSAHRIELAIKDAFQKMSDFSRIDDMALNLYILFRNSGKCSRILLLLAERLGVIVQRFPKASGTQFQVHKYNAVKCLTVNFLPLCLFAENMIEASNKAYKPEQKAKLRGYFNQWQTYQYLACLQLYRLTLRETAHLSYCCQDANMLVTDVITTFKSASDVLNATAKENTETGDIVITAKATNLPANQRFKDSHQLTEKQKVQTEKFVTTVTESYTLKRVREGKAAVENIRSKLIPDIAAQIQQRMESFDNDLFAAYRIGDHTQWDYSNQNYGTAEIRTISTHFKPCLDYHNFSLDMALNEWKCLKRLVQGKFAHLSSKIHFWVQIFSHHHQEFPHILLIIELILITPYSSATVERGFSLMGRLLSNTRLALSNTSLDDFMLIKINLQILQMCDSGYEQKLINKAVDMYLDAKRRRESAKCTSNKKSYSVGANTSEATYLPTPASSVIPISELVRPEVFLSVSDDDSDSCVTIDSDTDSDIE